MTASPKSFAYRAQDAQGQPVSGTIDASDFDEASARLRSLSLRIISIDPVSPSASSQKPLNSADFLAFNEQLAQLTTAGLPIEHGLKLIAQDLRGGRLGETVAAVSSELERGTSLADALALHRDQFPPLYSRLVEAGVRSNSLGGLLLNLSVHLEMVRRLRAALWRATSYPLMVFAGLLIVLLFLSRFVFPQFQLMFDSYRPMTPLRFHFSFTDQPAPNPPFPTMPLITSALFAIGRAVPGVVIALAALLVVLPLLWRRFYYTNGGAVERLSYRIPLIGPIMRTSLLARWCDIARLGVTAGLDLPSAIRLAGDAIDSPSLKRDGNGLIGNLEAGRRFDAEGRMEILPRVVPVAIEMASRTNNLSDVLASLSDVYRRQSETLLDNLPTILSPILLVTMAVAIGFVICALMLPVLDYIRYFSGDL